MELIEAVITGNIKRIKHILAHRSVDINHQDEYGLTALQHAVMRKNPDIVKLLLSYKDVKFKTNPIPIGLRPLHLAVGIGTSDIPKEVMQLLVEKDKSQLNISNEEGRTLLHYACSSKKLNLVKIIIDNLPDINHKDNNGRTCLHYAAYYLDYKTIEYLLDYTSINPKIQDNNGKTALWLLPIQYRQYAFVDVPVCNKLIKGTLETNSVSFEEIFKFILWATSKTFLGQHLIRKFYGKNNSKYHLIERLEKCLDYPEFTNCQGYRYYLYAFIHDQVSEEDIKVCNILIIQEVYYALMETVKSSDKTTRAVLEIFEYFNTIGFYDSRNTGNFKRRFAKDVGQYVLPKIAENLTSILACNRLYAVIKFFSEEGFNIDRTLESFLDRFLLWNPSRFQQLTRIIPILLPFTTNFCKILTNFLKKDKRLKLNENATAKEFFKNLLQNYGDTTETGRIKGIELDVFSLKHICRDKIRRKLLKRSKSYSNFFCNLNSLKAVLPRSCIAYLKFD